MSKHWRKTRDYRIWRTKVIRKDTYCVISGDIKNRHAHHLNSGAYHPKERFDVNNGIILSGFWHKLFHISYMRGWRKKTTKKDFIAFLKMIRILGLISIQKEEQIKQNIKL